jgi:hypothetical protein
MKLSEVAQRQAQHLIVFGDPKVGKSQLVAELTKHFNLFWFSLDGGHSILYKLPQEQQAKVRIIILPDTGDYPIAAETCRKVMKGGSSKICNLHGKFSCFICLKNNAAFEEVELSSLGLDWIIVWDNISQLGDSIMNHLTKDKEDTFKPGWDEYMPQGQLLTKFLSAIQQSPQHHICIAHCIEAELEDGKLKVFPLCGTRNYSRGVGKYFDHMIHVDVRNKKHTFGSKTTYLLNISTGSRTDVNIEDMKPEEVSLLPFFKIENQVSAKVVLTELKGGITK